MSEAKKPFWWYGGKAALVPDLLNLIPDHKSYIEVFGGSAALLFAKAPVRLNVYNDMDQGLVHFFRTLRDKRKGKELCRQLSLTLYARQEWTESKYSWIDEPDPVAKARMWYTVAMQGFASNHGRAYGFAASPGTLMTDKWLAAVNNLPQFIDRMKNVQVDNISFDVCIPRYDSKDALFYLDPPYMTATRKEKKVYLHEMGEPEHKKLLELAIECKGKVIISGYDHPLYHEALEGWQCFKFQQTCSSVARTKKSGYQGKGKISALQQRTECVWIKPNSMIVHTLFPMLSDVLEPANALALASV